MAILAVAVLAAGIDDVFICVFNRELKICVTVLQLIERNCEDFVVSLQHKSETNT